jgi:hypothetical protein
VVEGGVEVLDGGGGVEGDSDARGGLAPLLHLLADLLGGVGGVGGGFDVEGEVLRAGPCHGLGVADGVGDHQVGVEEGSSSAAGAFDDGGAEADVGDEVAVHDVAVEEVRPGGEDLIDLSAEFCEVGGEDGGEEEAGGGCEGIGGHGGESKDIKHKNIRGSRSRLMFLCFMF